MILHKWRKTGDSINWHRIAIYDPSRNLIKEIKEWVRETPGDGCEIHVVAYGIYHFGYAAIRFKNEDDALHFKLKFDIQTTRSI